MSIRFSMGRLLSLPALPLLILAACGGEDGQPGGTAPLPPPVNQPPTLGSPGTLADHNRPYSYQINAQDPEGGTVTLTTLLLPGWLTFDANTARLSGTAGWNNIRNHQVVIEASDGDTTTVQDFTIVVIRGEVICQQDFGDPAASLYDLPWRAGKVYSVIQSYCPSNPTWGHHDWFAYDFDTQIGDTLLATRGGQVIAVEERFTDGNRVRTGGANWVFIEHSDGTVMQYVHLTQNGALVAVGDVVTQGQPIALSGDTGWSSGPHVHVALFRNRTNFDRHSTLPLNFRNALGALDANRGLVQGAGYSAGP